MVYALRARLKVTSKILCYGRVRDTTVTRIIQSGLHKLIADTGIKPWYKEDSTYSPASIIAIRSDRMLLENALGPISKLYVC